MDPISIGIGVASFLGNLGSQRRQSRLAQETFDVLGGQIQSLEGLQERAGEMFANRMAIERQRFAAPARELGIQSAGQLGVSGFSGSGAQQRSYETEMASLGGVFGERSLSAFESLQSKLDELEQQRYRLEAEQASLDTEGPKGLLGLGFLGL